MHKKLLISLRIRPSFFDKKMLCPKEIKIILFLCHLKYILSVSVMVFNATFNNISVISWRSIIIGGGNRSTRRKPSTCRKSLTNFITYCCIEHT